MKKITKVMAACDLSKYAFQIIAYAAELADGQNAELVVVNVINQREIDAMKKALGRIRQEIDNFPVTLNGYVDGLRKKRSREIDELIEKLHPHQLTIRTVFRTGVPYHELVRAVEDEGADLVVMGTLGRTHPANMIFGSTAEKMFRHCPVPLMSIRVTASVGGKA